MGIEVPSAGAIPPLVHGIGLFRGPCRGNCWSVTSACPGRPRPRQGQDGPGHRKDDTTEAYGEYNFVVAASRLPVDRTEGPDGETEWRPSPGGLVTALEPVMRDVGGAWVGWPGTADDAPEPFDTNGMHLVSVGLSEEEVADYYEGFCNATLWPLYHDVIAQPEFRRPWWDAYVRVNRRYAEMVAAQAARGATVWVHDYQLQLVPGMVRELRTDVRIGHFTHIPFPGYEIFAQLPWRRQIVRGLLGADLLGFQRHSDATNFLRACRRSAGLATRGSLIRVPDAGFDDTTTEITGRSIRRQRVAQDNFLSGRDVRAAAFPISIDTRGFEKIARAAGCAGPGPGDPRGPGQTGHRAARHRPAGLHQGHPAPAQRLRRGPRRGAPRTARRGTGPGGQPQPGARGGVPPAAGRRRGHGRPDQRGARRGRRRRPCTTCTSPTPGKKWPRCTWRLT